MLFRISICAIIFLPLLLSAEVFSLWPLSGAGGGTDEALRPSKLWSENVIVDGHSLEMSVSLLQNKLDVCYANLRKLYPDASFAANRNSLLVEFKQKNGTRRRLYLLSLEGVYPTIQFSMELPAGPMKPADWPQEFPLPAGARPITTMHFPKRNAVYGAFSSDYDVSQTLPDVVASLKANGWQSVTAEHRDVFSGTGEVFLKNSPSSILVIGFTPKKKGGCVGTLYQRKLN